MDKKFFTKENIMCVLATMIIVLSYGAQRIIEVALSPDKSLALILAIVYTLLLAVVLFLISKSNNSYFGILAALIGYKMMPPPVNFLSQTTVDGSTLYFLVGKAAALLFVIVIYKLYKSQEEPHEIRSLPLLVILLSIPFFSEIAQVISNYFMFKTGDMLYCYFVQFALYAAAVLVVLGVAYVSGYSSLKFTKYFECVALSINILRRLGKIGYLAISHQHISKSNYVWIALYIVLIICFFVAEKKKKKELS
ncbi:MAG: hypothetical protein IJR70_07420 [Eubacterium sp.]|nr:hypothetical protein [Eubacterium sp.]